jgi:hypothetical protein
MYESAAFPSAMCVAVQSMKKMTSHALDRTLVLANTRKTRERKGKTNRKKKMMKKMMQKMTMMLSYSLPPPLLRLHLLHLASGVFCSPPCLSKHKLSPQASLS